MFSFDHHFQVTLTDRLQQKPSHIFNKILQQILPRYPKIIKFIGKFHLILGFQVQSI